MKKISLSCIIVSLFSLLYACDEDSDTLPSYRQDLAELRTTADGKASKMWRDDGTCLNLLTPLAGLTPDSIYRVYAIYTEAPEGAQLNHCALVHAPFPEVLPQNLQKRDPLSVVAAWKTERYANLQLLLKSKSDAQHGIAFHHDETVDHADGTTAIHLTLMHNANDAPQHYTREVFVSCPLYQFPAADTVHIAIATFAADTIYTLF